MTDMLVALSSPQKPKRDFDGREGDCIFPLAVDAMTRLMFGIGLVAPNGAIWSWGAIYGRVGMDGSMDVERPLLSVYGPMFDAADATPKAGGHGLLLLLLLLNKEMIALWSSTSASKDRGRGGKGRSGSCHCTWIKGREGCRCSGAVVCPQSKLTSTQEIPLESIHPE